MTHDQNFKNLILDYPHQAIEFFAPEEAEHISSARIVPVRQEQIKDRLGDHFHETDTPILAEWDDGTRKAVLFLFEEDTEPSAFSIHRLARYCLHLAELFKTDRIVPVVIFLRPGKFKSKLWLGDQDAYLKFKFVACHLCKIPAQRYMNSGNIVARVNLPNMRYKTVEKISVYAKAIDGLMGLENNPNKRVKYTDFIDFYAGLSENERKRYTEKYLPASQHKEDIMSLRQMFTEEGIKIGIEQGLQQGLQQGETRVLKRQIARRFGTVPLWADERMKQAKPEDLEKWIDRILDAATIEEVFGVQ